MHTRTWGSIGLMVVCASAMTAHSQVITPIDIDSFPEGETVVWGDPGDSGSTQGIFFGPSAGGTLYQYSQVVIPQPGPNPPANDWCPSVGVNCLDDAAYEIGFAWRDPTDLATTGVRCSSAFATNVDRPSIHLDGKIRFKMAVTVFDFAGDVTPEFPFGFQDQTGNPSIFMCLAIRETGRDLPLGTSDTSGGDIELVYLPLSEVIPAATNGFMADTLPGQNIANGGKRYNATTDLWPPEDNDFVNGGAVIEFDLGALTSAQIRGFANNLDGTDTAGDGALDATLNPNGNGVNRGTLEAIIFTNDPNNAALGTPGEYFFIYIDDLELEAPVDDPTPPPTVQSPILRNDTQVTVTDLSTNATLVQLKVNSIVELTTNAVTSTTFVFDLPAPAVPGDVYTATQTVDGIASVDSTPVTVSFPGPAIGLLPKDGDTMVRITGIDPAATEVELFVDAVSRGITTNGILTLPFTLMTTTGTPLVMGEEITATQVVDGGTSDLSPVSIVTTNSITTVFCDDFEYADQAAFDAVWTAHSGDVQLVLSEASNATVGGSKSAFSDDTGSGVNANQSQLITEFGATVGTNTHPIIFNVSYNDGLLNGGLYRQQVELRASGLTAPLVALGKTNQILGNFHSARLVGGADWRNLSGFGQPERTNGWHVLTAVIKTSTVDFDVDGTLAELNATFTTSAALATALMGAGLSSAGGVAYYDDLCVETGALHFNTITTQPPPPPTIEAPILPGAISVTVIDINTNSTLASLYLNGGATPIDTIALVDQDTVVFTIAPAISNDVYTATQTKDALESAESDPVTVLLPPPTLYKASADGETSVRVVDIDTNASVVRVKVNGIERGSIAPNGADDIVVPLTAWTLAMGEEVTANMTVNTILSVDSDPDTVTVNTVQSTIWCDDFESYADQTAFNTAYPNPVTTQLELSTARNATVGGAQSMYAPIGSPTHRSRSPVQVGAAGTNAFPVVWSVNIFDDIAGADVNQYADLNNLEPGDDFYLTEIGIAAPQFTGLGQPETHYQARLVGNGAPAGTNNGWFHLDQFNAPTRSVGWHTFTVVYKGPPPGATEGHELDFYVDGELAFKNRVLQTDTVLRRARIGSGQTSSAEAYFDDYCAEVGPVAFPTIAAQPPNKPAVTAPLERDNTTVTVTNVGPDATLVRVLANGSPIGSVVDPAGTNGVVVVPVTALVHLDAITADQTNAFGISLPSDVLEVGRRNGDITVSMGIRETGDAGPLGSTGGTTGALEWISAGSVLNGAPQGEALTPSGRWRTFVFDPASDPITAFTGNGVIDGTRGTLEHLAVSVDSLSAGRSTGSYTMYIDNVVNIGADGGSDFIVADFEANSNGDEVLFQEPTNSGSTFPADLTPLPSASEVTSAQANGGQRSAVLRWFWKDTTDQRWARITTSGANFLSRPIIDITKPVSMDLLLAADCMTVVGDADGDGDFDADDFDDIVACLDGPGIGYDTGCECADMNGDLEVDLADYAVLQRLLAP